MYNHQVDGLAIYRFETEWIGTNMYVLIHCGAALIVDPHFDEKAFTLLLKEKVKKVLVLLTHEHPDHTYGIPDLMKSYETTIICQKNCADAIALERCNRPVAMLMHLSEGQKNYDFVKNWQNYTIKADITFDDIFEYEFGEHKFKFIHAPGHSKGGCLIYMDDKTVFTGDNLILNTPVITRFPGGSTEEYNSITKTLLNSIDDEMLILPGHGPVFKMKDARQ